MIALDFGTLAQADLLKLANIQVETCEVWQKPMWQFVVDWLDEIDYLTVTTSGSTGKPKPIKLKKENMRNSALTTGKYFQFEQGQVALLGMSCNFIGGKMMLLRALIFKMKLLVVALNANPLEGLITPIDFVPLVPLQLQAAIEAGIDFTQIKNILLGGAALSPALEKQVQNLPSAVYASYGMTETISHIAIRKVNQPGASEWYSPLPNVTVELDERQCLVIKAPLVCEMEIITNDVAKLSSENGQQKFKILGRYDFVINSGGLKINPEQLEEKLSSILFPSKYIITSIPDERLGNQIVLLLEGAEKANNNLAQAIKQLLDKYENPKQIIYLPEFIYTESGKINRLKTTALILGSSI